MRKANFLFISFWMVLISFITIAGVLGVCLVLPDHAHAATEQNRLKPIVTAQMTLGDERYAPEPEQALIYTSFASTGKSSGTSLTESAYDHMSTSPNLGKLLMVEVFDPLSMPEAPVSTEIVF